MTTSMVLGWGALGLVLFVLGALSAWHSALTLAEQRADEELRRKSVSYYNHPQGLSAQDYAYRESDDHGTDSRHSAEVRDE